MVEPQGGDGTSGTRRKGTAAKRAMAAPTQEVAVASPCGACKFLRRKCIGGCIFAPHFGSDQGAARFAAVHKVFGASNVSKLLLHIPVNHRHEAAVTISYEAQVASLQAELSMMQTQLINSRFAYANALQITQQPNSNVGLQPAYSNHSSASTTLMNVSSFNPGFDLAMETPSSHSLEPLQLSRLSQ